MSAQANVTRLPTAPRRKTQQKHNKASRAAKAALRAEQGREFPYIYPQVRAATREAELLLGCTKTPELALVMAIWSVLPDDLRGKAECSLSSMAPHNESAQQALALVRRRTIGERVVLDAALDLLNGKG